MTKTAKPTPGPWIVQYDQNSVAIGLYHIKFRSELDEVEIARVFGKDNAHIIAEAGTVYHETNLTPRQLLEQRDELQERVRELEAQISEQRPQKLWLWRNFVDGRPEYWAFDNPFPVYLDSEDPQTLGEPCGYAIVKASRCGRFDVSEEEVIADIRAALAKHGEGV